MKLEGPSMSEGPRTEKKFILEAALVGSSQLGTTSRCNLFALNKDGRGDIKEHAMTTHSPPVRLNRPTNDELHPLVYRSIIGLTIWLVLSVWVLFSRGEYGGLTLSIITLFFVILVAIPVLLWLTWRRNVDHNERHGYVARFAEWTSQPFENWTGSVSGREATIQILLPIAAVAFGMTIFGLAFLFAVPHLG
jgi:hypothetical protein